MKLIDIFKAIDLMNDDERNAILFFTEVKMRHAKANHLANTAFFKEADCIDLPTALTENKRGGRSPDPNSVKSIVKNIIVSSGSISRNALWSKVRNRRPDVSDGLIQNACYELKSIFTRQRNDKGEVCFVYNR